MITRRTLSAASSRLIRRPSMAMASCRSTRWPRPATAPLTLTRPALIQPSISRREARPMRAMTFCSFSPAGLYSSDSLIWAPPGVSLVMDDSKSSKGRGSYAKRAANASFEASRQTSRHWSFRRPAQPHWHCQPPPDCTGLAVTRQLLFVRGFGQLIAVGDGKIIEIGLQALLHGVQLGQQAAEAGFLACFHQRFIGERQVGASLQALRRGKLVIEGQRRFGFQLTQGRQRRELVETLQIEVIEKCLGGRQHRRLRSEEHTSE